MPPALTQEEFIERSNKAHNNKFDYSKAIYTLINKKVVIICPEHGEFEQYAHDHMNGVGCPDCAGVRRKTTEEFIRQAIMVHGYKYDYSKVNYINKNTKIIIICRIHGEFTQSPKVHLRSNGCNLCSGKKKKDTEEFIKKAIKIHGSKYDYSLVDYECNSKKVKIRCHEHGIFEQTPKAHLRPSNCPDCIGRGKKTTERFIIAANKIHNNRYDYSKVVYITNKNPVIITCHLHGDFIKTPNRHINGEGCSGCTATYNNFERLVKNAAERICKKYGFADEFIKTRPDWLTNPETNRCLELDLYCDKLKVAIEVQGSRHYMVVEFYNMDEEDLEKVKYYDKLKKELCTKNYVVLVEIRATSRYSGKWIKKVEDKLRPILIEALKNQNIINNC